MTMIAQEMNLGRALAEWVSALRADFRKWRLYRETVVELNRLDEVELDDLGFARADIKDVAEEAVYGRHA